MELRTTARTACARPAGPTPNPLEPRNAGAAPLARGVLSTQRLSVRLREPRPVDAARTVRTPTRRRRRRMCMPCRCMPNPPLATRNRTRHVCAADNLQTRCKHVANNRRRSPPLKAIPGNRAEVGKMPALKGFRRCPSAHQMRQLTSYADGFDEPGRGWRGKIRKRGHVYARRGFRRAERAFVWRSMGKGNPKSSSLMV